MLIAFGILLLLIGIIFHELGHYYAFRKLGVEIKEICILGFGPKLFSFKTKYFGNTEISVRLFPFGAFVMPNTDDCEKKITTYKDQAFVSGIGPVASVIYGVFLLLFIMPKLWLFALLVILIVFHKQITHLILPIGMIALGLIIWSITQMEFVNESGGGFSTVYEYLSKHATVEWILKYVGILEIALGLFNGAPMWITDGQHIMNKALEKYPNVTFGFRLVGFLIIVYLTIQTVLSDLIFWIKNLL